MKVRVAVAVLATVAGLFMVTGTGATAAVPTQQAIAIRGTVQPYVVTTVVPTGAWEFDLEVQAEPQGGGYRARDPGYRPGDYSLRLDANTRVTLRLLAGEVATDAREYAPAYVWSLSPGTPGGLLLPAAPGGAGRYEPPGPADFYDSGGPVAGARINLDDFSIVSGDPARAGPLGGTLIVEVSTPE